MRIDELKPFSKTKPKKRIGRGLGSGKGKTSGRGMNGQKSRSGYNIPKNFEGGQSTLIARTPKKRGFKSHKINYISLNIRLIEEKFGSNEEINPESLVNKSLISGSKTAIKLFGQSSKDLIIRNCKVSKSLEKFLKKD